MAGYREKYRSKGNIIKIPMMIQKEGAGIAISGKVGGGAMNKVMGPSVLRPGMKINVWTKAGMKEITITESMIGIPSGKPAEKPKPGTKQKVW